MRLDLVKPYLLERINQSIRFFIKGNSVFVITDIAGANKNVPRSFCLTARETKSLFSRNKISYFISDPQDIKIFISQAEMTTSEQLILPNEEIVIDNIHFTIDGKINIRSEKLLKVKGLNVEVKGQKILNNISFEASRGELLIIMGPSGCGKTTLLKEIAGLNNRVSGTIQIDGQSLYENFHSKIKARIGYVEQFDNLHADLTVSQVLKFTSKIRCVANYKKRIESMLIGLNLVNEKNKHIRVLSGGQSKRVAIVNELLDQPDLILLDEPTSPLDPQSIDTFLAYIKKQAEVLNKVVVMVTHKPSDLEFADKVLFLAAGGHQVYFGSRNEFLDSLSAKLKISNRLNTDEKILEVYSFFSLKENGTKNAVSFNVSITNEDHNNYQKDFNIVQQFWWLLRRYAAVKFPLREKIHYPIIGEVKKPLDGWIKNIFFFLIQPFLVGLLFYSFPYFNTTSLFLISLATIWFGINNSSKEIVEEVQIFKRERSYNLKIHAYLFSKILLIWVLSCIQILVLLMVVYKRFDIPPDNGINISLPFEYFKFLSLLSFSSITLGLLISTISEKVDKVLIWIPLVLMAQIVFSGLVSKPDKALKENVSYFMLGRWGMEGLSRIQDSIAPKKRYIFEERDPNIETEKNKTFKKDTVMVPQSLVVDRTSPPPNDTLKNDTTSAYFSLGAYNARLKRDKIPPWTMFDSLRWNYIVIFLHGLLAYFLCTLVLLKKDYIPSNFLCTPIRLTFLLNLVLFIIISWVLCSPYYKDRVIKPDYKLINRRIENIKWYKKVSGEK